MNSSGDEDFRDGWRPSWDKLMEIKSLYSNAMDIELLLLDPPYTGMQDSLYSIGDMKDDFGTLARWGELEETERRSKENKIADSSGPRDWFKCLDMDLFDLEKISKRTEKSLILRHRLFIVTFLHKSSEFRHIETLWMYAKRFGLGERDVGIAFERWPEQQPTFANNYLTSLIQFQPDRNSIESLLASAILQGRFKLQHKEKEHIIGECDEVLERMKSWKDGDGKDFLTICVSKAKHNSSISLAGETLTAVGLIESLLLREVSNKARGFEIKEGVATGILETLFPSPSSGTALWRTTLSSDALRLVDNFGTLIRHHLG